MGKNKNNHQQDNSNFLIYLLGEKMPLHKKGKTGQLVNHKKEITEQRKEKQARGKEKPKDKNKS
jgi:hypothetical protein